LFEVSPISRINLDAPVHFSQEEMFNMQMLHAYFQNFISSNFTSYEEGMTMSESIHQEVAHDLHYRDRGVLRRTVVGCIEKLMGPNPKYENELDRFVFGYSGRIHSKAMKNAIGDWFEAKDRYLRFMWDMF
jgi:hypothetical protein